ncbi:MAG TPA: ferrochelatase [Pyrinomonadaceae bacterium]|nr:ferrochelatase [Pyrinomonadaceae bacterium]
MKRTGVLLINLGTPDEPSPEAVGRFLREFLMDGFVLDIPAALRWPLVNVAIVPRRRKQSALLYQKIHSDDGAPLLFHTKRLANEVSAQLSATDAQYLVKFGMRYGNPSIASVLAELCAADVDQILVLPLYPQYAESSFETAVVETKKRARELGCAHKLVFLPPFYADPHFINACAQRVTDHLSEYSPDHILFSFHGVPVRHIKRLDQSQLHCVIKPNCCDEIAAVNQNCYRAQCFSSANAIREQVGLSEQFCTTSFQSRFGRTEWVGPATDEVLRNLARNGVRRVAVFCPSFVADCLETLEEIAIRGNETFLEAGGEELKLIPSLNTHPVWVAAVAGWILEASARSSC